MQYMQYTQYTQHMQYSQYMQYMSISLEFIGNKVKFILHLQLLKIEVDS